MPGVFSRNPARMALLPRMRPGSNAGTGAIRSASDCTVSSSVLRMAGKSAVADGWGGVTTVARLAPHPCSATCHTLVYGPGRCEACRQRTQRSVDRRRGTAHQRGYTRQWRTARMAWLAEHPLCADPYGVHADRVAAASVVDHIVPHQGDPHRFWSADNWQSLCSACHSRKTASEDGGFGRPVGR